MTDQSYERVAAVFAERIQPGGDDFLDEEGPGSAIEMVEEIERKGTSRDEDRMFCTSLQEYLVNLLMPIRNRFVIMNVWMEIVVGSDPDDDEITVHVYLECPSN
mgnify:CR=1 FL=1